jgi:hypothetical protein
MCVAGGSPRYLTCKFKLQTMTAKATPSMNTVTTTLTQYFSQRFQLGYRSS